MKNIRDIITRFGKTDYDKISERREKEEEQKEKLKKIREKRE